MPKVNLRNLYFQATSVFCIVFKISRPEQLFPNIPRIYLEYNSVLEGGSPPLPLPQAIVYLHLVTKRGGHTRLGRGVPIRTTGERL